MRIGLFADPHDSTKDVSCVTRRPSLSWGKIQRAMEAFVGVDLVVCLGDLTDDCVDPEDNAPRLRALSEMIRGYGISFVSLMGNHDCNVFTREEFDALGGNRPPFSLRFNNVLLIFLDANYARNGVPYKPGTVDWTDVLSGLAAVDYHGFLNFEVSTVKVPGSAREAFGRYIHATAEELRALYK